MPSCLTTLIISFRTSAEENAIADAASAAKRNAVVLSISRLLLLLFLILLCSEGAYGLSLVLCSILLNRIWRRLYGAIFGNAEQCL